MLALSVLISMVSCRESGEEDGYTVVAGDGATEFVLVRGEFADTVEAAAARRMRDELKNRYGCDIALNDDFVRAGRVEAKEYEIVIGATKREESAAQQLLSRDFIIKRIGNRIVIKGGTPEYTALAVNYFIENYFTGKGVVIPKDLDYYCAYDYPVKKLSIEGSDISGFTILFSDGYEDAAEELRDAVERASGIILSVTDNPSKAGNRQIRIAVNEDKPDNNSSTYTVIIKDGSLIFTGGKKANIRPAVTAFIQKFLAADGETEIDIKGEMGIEGEEMIKSLKVLAIGNSFSIDAMAYLYQIAEDMQVDEIILGNLYIPGCSLSTHWSNASRNSAAYEYYRNTSGEWQTTPNVSIQDAIKEVDWDFITLQQASGSSGRADTYEPFLTNLIDYVKANATNPDVKLAWHMTWAYQADSPHVDFPHYGSEQITMYNAIIQTVQSAVVPKSEIAFVIPAGTAVQNVRATEIGDIVTSDGYHLSVPLGRYIAGLTWAAMLIDYDIENVAYYPNGIKEEYIPLLKEAVKKAMSKPFEISE